MAKEIQTTEKTKAVSKIDVMKNMLNANTVQEQFKNALGKNSSAFVTSIIDLYNGDSYLQGCAPKLVVMEALKAAVLKLPINKSLGFAYIVPYKVKGVLTPQFQTGYKGFIQLAMRTGQYKFINADIVYEGELESSNKLTGEINFGGKKKSDKIVGYFSYIELLNGFSKTFYMTKKEVEAHGKRYSPSYGHTLGRWKNDFDGMALKTVLKYLLSHYGYLSIEMIGAFDNDSKSDNSEAPQEENEHSESIDINAEIIESKTNKPVTKKEKKSDKKEEKKEGFDAQKEAEKIKKENEVKPTGFIDFNEQTKVD